VPKKTLSVAEIKTAFSEHLREVERGDPIVITRHGKAIAALVPADDLARLERLRSAGPEGGLASLAGGWEDSEDLVRVLETSPRIGQRENVDLE